MAECSRWDSCGGLATRIVDGQGLCEDHAHEALARTLAVRRGESGASREMPIPDAQRPVAASEEANSNRGIQNPSTQYSESSRKVGNAHEGSRAREVPLTPEHAECREALYAVFEGRRKAERERDEARARLAAASALTRQYVLPDGGRYEPFEVRAMHDLAVEILALLEGD